MKKREFFKIDGNKINRIRKHCPKCGPAVFLADHKNRFSCGKCGYTEFKGGGSKEPIAPNKVEKPIEQSEQKIDKPHLTEEKASFNETEQPVDETTKDNQLDEKNSNEEIKDKQSED